MGFTVCGVRVLEPGSRLRTCRSEPLLSDVLLGSLFLVLVFVGLRVV